MIHFLSALLLVTIASPSLLGQSTPSPGASAAPPAGVCLYFDGIHARQSDAAERIDDVLDRLVALEFSSVCIAFPFFMGGWTASEVSYQEEIVPTREELDGLMAAIRSRGLSVGLRPLLEESTLVSSGPAGTWRGTIAPEGAVAWFASYTDLLLHYAGLATEHDIAWLAIGTELNSLEAEVYEPYWRQLIHDVRASEGGSRMQLLYSQNHDVMPTAPAWFAELDIIGIDPYFPLDGVGNDATVEELVVAMEQHRWKIDQLRAQFPDKPLYVTELGISSVDDVYQRPFLWGEASDSPANMETQARYAAAACRFYAGTGETAALADGVYWWFATINPPEEPLNDKGLEFLGKPAQEEIAACNRLSRPGGG